MKKLFLLAALAAMAFASCEKGPKVPAGQASITIKIAGESATRAYSAPVSDFIPEITTGYIYVVEGTTILHSETLTARPGTAGQTLADGRLFPATSQIYVLANVPSDVTGYTEFGSFTDIQNAVSEISYSAPRNTDYKHPAMGNKDGLLVGVTETSEGVAEVEVSIAPLYARIELAGVKAGEWIQRFKVTGVWLDDYNTSFSMTGVGKTLKSMGQDVSVLNSTWFGDMTPAAALSDGGWASWSILDDASRQNSVKPTEGIWAYHVGGGSTARFIIELTDVYAYPPMDPEDLSQGPNSMGQATLIQNGEGGNTVYITVSGYGAFAGPFKPGNIYQVSTIEFNEVGDMPNDEGVTITATIKVIPWNPVPLTPVL